MNASHHSSLTQYINDVIALERDIANALEVQLEDERVIAHANLYAILSEMRRDSLTRIEAFSELSEEEGGSIGGALKEGVMAVTGTLAGWYGKVREHPVSRMVRDDITAAGVAATSYSMLLTLALAFDHSECQSLALRSLHQCPGIVIRLHDLLPEVIVGELAQDGPVLNPAAAQVARMHFRDAWNSRV